MNESTPTESLVANFELESKNIAQMQKESPLMQNPVVHLAAEKLSPLNLRVMPQQSTTSLKRQNRSSRKQLLSKINS
jgi:hypothetical protein